ncbi:sulfite exporter TauE/SafE family protein [Novosphingobium terrae]|uniref:sulfite exporter TauE/SafE family protein n=1 Tax=Novosphingobium terrae TaxID=2726189 RepID=UPI00197E77D8|nr:sulfite exporter TauE/SafE family protein [Novosphingobium terrae]
MLDSAPAVICAGVAVILSGMSKGGFAGIGALAMPVMALANPPLESAAVLLPILVVQDVVSVWSFRKSWDRTVLLVMLPGMAMGVLLGYLFAARVSESAVLGTVGALSLLFGLQRLWQERGNAVVLPSTSPRWLGVLFGIGSGFGSQVAHAGAQPFQMWVLPRRLPRDALVGSTAICFAFMNWIKVPAYLALGQFSRANLLASAALMPVALAATMGGVVLVRKVDPARFYRIIYALMIAIGIKLVLDGVGWP